MAECDRLLGEIGRVVAGLPDGPMRARLGELRDGVAVGVEDAVRAAARAGEVERLTATMDLAGITDAFKRARRDADAAARRGDVPADLAERVESFRRQHESANRLLNTIEETDRHLTALRARLTELVLTAAELSISSTADTLDAVEARAGAVASEVNELRHAFDDLT
jgi:hypothetical protein